MVDKAEVVVAGERLAGEADDCIVGEVGIRLSSAMVLVLIIDVGVGGRMICKERRRK